MRYRALVLGLFVFFLLFHYADRFTITAVAADVMKDFDVDYIELGLVFTATLLVSACLYPLWGYLFDRYSRRLLVSATSVIWGFTSLINALSRSFSEFFATRLSTAVDDAAPPGMMSLVLDYFEPERRARAMGIVKITAPLGAILGTVLPLSIVSAGLSWRYSFYVTGTVGIITGILLYVFVRDVPRGISEPELREVLREDIFRARVRDLIKLLKNKSLLLIFLGGFWGQFPWAVIAYWIITHMRLERGLSEWAVMVTMVTWLVAMAAGSVFSGYIGDLLYRKSIRGRAAYSTVVVLLSSILVYMALKAEAFDEFFIYGALTAFTMVQYGPQVSAMWGDVAEPELRSSAASLQSFFETIGSGIAPSLAGYLGKAWGLGSAILSISVLGWLLCSLFFTALVLRIPKDYQALRATLSTRAEELLRKAGA
ncbi:MAG: MFS transporter [Thermofilaceae archaeon]